MHKRHTMLACLAAGLAMAFVGGAAAQDLPKVNLKVSGGNRTQNMFRYIQEPFFTKQITADSNGAITTTFGSLDDLGIQGPEVLRLLRLGMFDISEGTLSYMAGEDPHFDALDLPGLTADIDLQRKSADAYRATLSKIMADKFNVKLLSMSPIALQAIYCKGDITGLDSLAGKKVRTFNRAMSDLVEAVGAASVNIPFAEVVPSMQRGVADCAITATSAGNTARWWEVTELALPRSHGLGDDLLRRQSRQLEPARSQGAGFPHRGIQADGRPPMEAGGCRHSGRHQLQHREG